MKIGSLNNFTGKGRTVYEITETADALEIHDSASDNNDLVAVLPLTGDVEWDESHARRLAPYLTRVCARRQATPQELQEARAMYADNSDDDIEIDDDAQVSDSDCGVWVQAWVHVPADDNDSDGD